MTNKQIANFRNRINKANKTGSSVIDLTLAIDISMLSQTDKIELQMALQFSKSPISYMYLDKKIKDHNKSQKAV